MAAKFSALPHGIKAGVPRLLFDSVLLGAVGAGSAISFIWLLHICQKLLLTDLAGYQPPRLPQEGGTLGQVIGPHGLWLIPLVTTVGGLLSGILVYGIAPEAEGHGTDTVVRSFHQAQGFLRARVAPLKMLASAITIGSGGSAGREGPIALIGAGFGSVYATLLHRPENERRLLILDAGIPVDIPGGRQLVAGALPDESPLAAKRVHEAFPLREAGKIDILALLNSDGVEIVDSETVLEPGQRVLGVVSPQGRDEFYQEFDPVRGMSNITKPAEAQR